MGSVVLDPESLRRTAGRLDAAHGELGRLAGQIQNVPIAGFPGDVAARVLSALPGIAAEVRMGGSILQRGAADLRRRAHWGDKAGDPFSLLPFSSPHHKWDPSSGKGPKPGTPAWEAALSYLTSINTAREALGDGTKLARADLRKMRRQVLKRLKGEGLDRKSAYKEWVRMRRRAGLAKRRFGGLGRGPAVRLPRPLRVKVPHFPNTPFLRRIPRFPVRTVDRVPLIGPAIDLGVDLADGRSAADAAGHTAAKTAGSVAGGAAGSAVCGAETAVTVGLGAAACPVLIGGGAIVGGEVGGRVYDAGKKAVEAIGHLIP